MHGLIMNYPLNIARILEHARRIHGDKRVTTYSSGVLQSYSYAEFYRRVQQVANVLIRRGIRPGDRVATYALNTYQHLELYYAIPCIGAVLHPLNVRLTATQLAEIVREAEDKLVFVDDGFASQFEELQEEIGCLPSIFFSTKNVGIDNVNDDTTQTDVFAPVPPIERLAPRQKNAYEALIAAAEETETWDIRDENWAMGLCYTSGTSGEPRGVLYTHRSMFLHTMAVNQADVFGLTEADVVLPLVPMFHAMAWGLPYASLFAGADLVLPGDAKPAQVAALIAETGVTVAAGVPTVWGKVYPELQKRARDIASLRLIIVGGEAMPMTLIEAYEKELGVEVRHAWGMTEMSPTGTLSTLRRAHQDLSDTEKWQVKAMQGRPVPGVEIRLVEEKRSSDELTGVHRDQEVSPTGEGHQDREVSPTVEEKRSSDELPWDGKTVGELQVRSPWTANSYYKTEPMPEHFTADGWLRTGDIATINPEGYVQIVDRAKALIRSGGESISSIALETALLAHPQVLDAAVIGIPDEQWGERPVAVVVCESATDAQLKACLATQFPKFWIPDRFIFVDELPKTSVGKSDKREIRRRVLS